MATQNTIAQAVGHSDAVFRKLFHVTTRESAASVSQVSRFVQQHSRAQSTGTMKAARLLGHGFGEE
jgi:hypothetical protein